MGLASVMILPAASPAASVELLGETPLGIFCSCIAATLPDTVTPPTNREVIELSNTLGALQGGGSSRKLHLLLCDYIAVYKGSTVSIFMYGFPNEGESKQLSIRCSVFLSLFKNYHQGCSSPISIPMPVLCGVI